MELWDQDEDAVVIYTKEDIIPKAGRKRERITLEHVELDPIFNAGGVKLREIIRDHRGTRIEHTLLLTNSTTWTTIQSTLERTMIYSHLSENVLKSAVDTKVLRPCGRGEISLYLRAFTIGKTTGGCRLIGHPEWLNAKMETTNKLQLGSTTTLIRAIHSELQASGATNVYYSESDFKNFFFQIPLHESSKKYFGLCNIDEKGMQRYFQMRVLVQGWDKSVHIAQCISWTALMTGEESLTKQVQEAYKIPGICVTRHGNDFLLYSVVYDNILIVSNNPTLRNEAENRLKTNCRKWNIQFKYIKTTEGDAKFCGLTFSWKNNFFTWKISDDVAEKWKHNCQSIENHTPRTIAHAYGIIARIAHVYLKDPTELFEISSEMGSMMRNMHSNSHTQWDVTDATLAPLHEKLINIIRHHDFTEVNFEHRHNVSNPWCIFTDASNDKLGYTIFQLSGEKIDEQTKLRNDTRPIFLAEADATGWALENMEQILKKNEHTPPDALVIGVDNQTVGRALLRGGSINAELHQIISTCWEITKRWIHPNHVAICDIDTKENVADVMTRSENIGTNEYDYRFKASSIRAREALELLKQGLRWSARTQTEEEPH
jgi:hypothetical protein